MKTSKFIFFLSLAALITLLLAFYVEKAALVQHEQTHQQICEQMGYESFSIYDGLTARTLCYNVTKADLKTMYPLDIQNEIISYNLRSIRIIGYIIIFFMIFGGIKNERIHMFNLPSKAVLCCQPQGPILTIMHQFELQGRDKGGRHVRPTNNDICNKQRHTTRKTGKGDSR